MDRLYKFIGLLEFHAIHLLFIIENGLELLLTSQHVGTLGIGFQDGLDGRSVISDNFLLDIENLNLGRDGELSGGDHLQQGGLSLTIGTNKTILFAKSNLEHEGGVWIIP